MIVNLRIWIAAAIVTASAASVVPASASAVPFEACVKDIRANVLKAGVKADIVDAAFRDIAFDEKVVRFSRNQPEYRLKIWDYMAFLVDGARIADGTKMMQIEAKSLRAIEKAYGVDRFILAALWGVESDYGKIEGNFFLPQALASLACAGRRPALFKAELTHALKIVAAGDVKLKDLNGSWAGAFGHTQFMPSTYRRLAVDFDGDGRKDTINSVPDALASSANFLKRAGWRPGLPWGFEVKVPSSYKGPTGRKHKAAGSAWAKRGLTRADGARLPKSGAYGLIRPAGKGGPAFLVSRNFDALYSYNAAESYALAIAHLSDRLRGKGGFKTAWPTKDPGLSRAERKRLQELLIAQGLYKGEADGRMGPLTAAAIREAEKKAGMKPTGRPGARILEVLAGN
ncbi:MAG: lytic murein transglycosylase [Parvibaculaceae bacterium]